MINRLISYGPAFIWAGACLAAMVAGGLGPWATVFGIADVSGTHGDGWFLIAGGVGGAALLLVHVRRAPHKRWLPIVQTSLAAICLAVAGYDLSDIAHVSEGGWDLVDPAWGLYVSFVASLSAVAAGVLITIVRPFAPAVEH
jgi:hypothetical protein